MDTYIYSNNNESTVNEDTCSGSIAYFNPSEETENRSNEVGNTSELFPDIPSQMKLEHMSDSICNNMVERYDRCVSEAVKE